MTDTTSGCWRRTTRPAATRRCCTAARARRSMEKPEYLVSLGRTLSLKANQAVSNVSITPYAICHGAAGASHRKLRRGPRPRAARAGVAVAASPTRSALPLVGTFHTYNENRVSNGIATALGARRMLNRLHVRIAVSEAAAWTARRFFGGHYRIIPNGVHVDSERAALGALRPQSDKLKIVFVGQAVERKGLPVLLRAFEALREHIPTELTVIGPSEQELSPLMLDMRDVRVLGKVDDETKRTELEAGDVLCAPSLGGESFGMVLTEAFAAGTPVIASDIAGYRDVVRDGVDGVLVPRGDAQTLAEALRDLYEEPVRRAEMARAAALGAERFAWPRVAAQVMEAYEDAIAVPEPATTLQRVAVTSRRARGRSEAARPGAAAGEPRAGADRTAAPQQGARRRAPRRPRDRVDRRRRARVPRAPEDRLDQHRQGADHREPDAGPARPRDHVQRDGDARLLVARDPQSRLASRPRPAGRRRPGDVHRRADVLDPAGPPRRAFSRARRGATNRSTRARTCRSCSARSCRRRCSTSSR